MDSWPTGPPYPIHAGPWADATRWFGGQPSKSTYHMEAHCRTPETRRHGRTA